MRTVVIDTATVGQFFGTVGVVKDARTGRKVAEAKYVRPYGFVSAALDDARTLAEDRGWTIEEEDCS